MCNVKSRSKHFLLLNEDGPTHFIESEGEKFIQLLSKKQLEKTTCISKLKLQENKFLKGTCFPPVPQVIHGLTSLQQFEDSAGNIEPPGDSCPAVSVNDTHSPCMVSQLFEVEAGRNFKNCALSTKPDSVETKLLSFFMKSPSQAPFQNIPDKKVFEQIVKINELYSVDTVSKISDIKEIRKSYLNLLNFKQKPSSFDKKSLWDVKKFPKQHQQTVSEPSLNSEIAEGDKKYILVNNNISEFKFPKVSDDEIRQINKFSNYSRGIPSKVLFLKNISHKTTEQELVNLVTAGLMACNVSLENITCKLLKGKMKGAALLSFESAEDAGAFLDCVNGFELHGKSIIIQYSLKNEVW